MNRQVFALLLAALLITVPTAYSLRAAGPVYTVEDLGTLDGLVPTITGMNAAGQISGHVSAPAGSRAVWFNDGVWNYVPGLSNTFSVTTGINRYGDLTGYRMVNVVLNGRKTNVLLPFRYVHGSTAVEGIDPAPGGTSATAFGIADNGAVVGSGTIAGVGTRAWIATGTAAALLPGLEEMTSKACGINANGQVAGSYTSPTAGTEHAFRLDVGDGMVNDLGTLDGGAGTSIACAIDSDGTVGGRSLTSNATLAFLSGGGTPVNVTPAGASVAEVKGIANGVAVGSFTLPASGVKHAFVYTDGDGTTDLNDRLAGGSDWVLSEAVAVNRNGLIAGLGTLAGTPRAFRLTPSTVSDTTPPTIAAVTASPASITPPNKAMVAVTVSAAATDDQDPNPSCAVTSVDGHGAPAEDTAFSGLSAAVRATGGATYTLTVMCSDASGNHATGNVDVVVPRDTTAPVFTSLVASPDTIWPPKGQFVTVTTAAAATDDSGETPVCTLAGIGAPGVAPEDYSVNGANTGTVRAVGGRTYVFHEVCTDAANNAASSEVTVTVPQDATAPVIASISATPSTASPPNGLFVTVAVAVVATDDVDDAPACALSSIDLASAPEAVGNDYAITGPFTATVRAVGGRTYTLNVTCSDAAGNTSAASSTTVVVPPDTTAPVIVRLTASPERVWPPNGALVPVSVAVVATDDVDATPACVVSSISANGSTPGDYSLSGGLTATVRAVGGRSYVLGVECSDAAGNHSAVSSTTVVVPADTTAPAINFVAATPSTITRPNGLFVPVSVAVAATDDVDAAPACALSSISSNGAPAQDAAIVGPLSARLRAVGGRSYRLNVACTDVAGNGSAAFATVVVPPDTTAPIIVSVTATPSTISSPTSLLVPVGLAVVATDDVDASPACALSSIVANGTTADDYTITGPLTALVRAVGGRTYALTVRCSDAAGNFSAAAATVVVLPDTTAPIMTGLTASPDYVWPANNKMVPVSLELYATDNVDASPQCLLASVTSNGGSAGDAVITGQFSASVRATKSADGATRVYSLRVKCSDRAGNVSFGVAVVTIGKDVVQAAARGKR